MMDFEGAGITVVMTLSIVGFFIFFTIITIMPQIIEPRKRKLKLDEKENITIDDIAENIALNQSFNYRFVVNLGEDRVTKVLLIISMAYLFSTLLCIGNLAIFSGYFSDILRFNMILVLVITMYTFYYLISLIKNSWDISSKYLEEIRSSLSWVK